MSCFGEQTQKDADRRITEQRTPSPSDMAERGVAVSFEACPHGAGVGKKTKKHFATRETDGASKRRDHPSRWCTYSMHKCTSCTTAVQLYCRHTIPLIFDDNNSALVACHEATFVRSDTWLHTKIIARSNRCKEQSLCGVGFFKEHKSLPYA